MTVVTMHTAHLFEVYSSIYNDRLGAHLEGMNLNPTSMRDSSCTADGFLLWRVVDAEMELCSVIALVQRIPVALVLAVFAQGEDVKMTSVKKHQRKHQNR